MLRPRAAILTLYGDYVRYRSEEIGIGSLIKLLGNFDLSEQSIRSAVSRMCRAGFLKVRHKGARSYYSLTREGLGLLEEGERRIFRRRGNGWDGKWSGVVYYIPEKRRDARDALRQQLTWMGYGALSTATWVSPHDLSKEVEKLVRKMKIKNYVQVFQAEHLGFTSPKDIISRCWDLRRIHKKYAEFIAEHRPRLEEYLDRQKNGNDIEPGDYFVERFMLIHAYRRLPIFDPHLPVELLPENWLRSEASGLFRQYHDLLEEKANRYFDDVLKSY
jgi:phenylacetic acid degradation operon negative regulatory protein